MRKTNNWKVILFYLLLTGVIASFLCGFVLKESAVAEEGTSATSAEASEEPAEEHSAEDTPYSFLWITDSQGLAYRGDKYEKLGNTCLEYIEKNNVVYFFGTGDYVGCADYENHWTTFRQMYEKITIPKILIAGNHDITSFRKNGKQQAIDKYISEIYGEKPEGERFYKNGLGVYDLFSAGGTDWIVIGMYYKYDEEAMEWMDGVLKQYSDRKAILLLHDYAKGERTLLPEGKKLYKKIVVPNENVRLILCGHCHGRAAWKQRPDSASDRAVVTVMYNFQGSKSYNGAPVLLTVDPQKSTLHFEAYQFLYGSGHIEYDTEIDLR